MKKTKKSLALALAVMLGCSVTGTALAATGTENPFTTVPSNHWAYPAVTQLVKAGLIDGYKDGDFRGDNAITRYEMASLVAKAMTHVDKADAANKAAIDKLSAEYANELNNLGVRVKNLEKKVNALGKMTIGGELRFRYDYAGDGVLGFDNDASDKQKNGQVRYRLNMTGPLDDNWKVNARYESQAAKFGGSGSDNLNTLARAYIEGDVSGIHVLAGRGNFKTFNAYTGWDKDNWDGAGVTIGNKVTLDLYAMKHGGADTTTTYATTPVYKADGVTPVLDKNGKQTYATKAVASFSQKNTWYKLAQLKYSFSPDFTMATQWLKNPLQDRKEYGASYDTIGVGFKYTGWDNLALSAEYAENRAARIRTTTTGGVLDSKLFTNDKPKGYEIKLDYGKVDKSKVGSWGSWVGYRYADDGFDRGDMTTGFRHDNAKAARMNNIKGVEVGLDYTPIKNTKFEAFYIAGKSVNGNDIAGTDNKHMAYAQMELFF
ncbi:S-layer homology domain-containing protein [Pelosinus sp. UFO1]|uniref:S-layer homology domain-containing protein n=1 Tax=Pelosinus sp. UFO1 TaxID=484770 RepID=UPI0004D0F632|nr:S-layer homology domain-containing protein [Pelosinus sp. UFO1]AIF50364.1 S-layer domain-containing protein [Pelosinus sp. UFO1]